MYSFFCWLYKSHQNLDSNCTIFQFFAFLYRLAGQSSDLTMVNSSWTEEHISALWGKPESLYKIYPPCDVTEFKMIKRKRYGICNSTSPSITSHLFQHPRVLKNVLDKLTSMLSSSGTFCWVLGTPTPRVRGLPKGSVSGKFP